ncbi:MAG: tetratricopeptide repeat protein [Rhodoferax sp.]
MAFHQRGQLVQAQALYADLLKIQPKQVDALYLLGVIAGQTGDHGRAIDLIGKAIEIKPDNPLFYYNLGVAFKELKQYDAAAESYRKAIAIKPDYAQAHSNCGIALKELGQVGPALASYDRAIAIKPDYAEAYWNKAVALLLSGDFDQGWALHEWRWRRDKAAARNFRQPLWLGKEAVAGKTILLHGEQGLGDTIQFCRYASLVADLGARVVLEVQPPLLDVLKQLTGVSEWVAAGAALPEFDIHCPLLSLPLAFNTRLDAIPASAQYLAANADKLTLWEGRLGRKAGPRIGLVWSGSSAHKKDHDRSVLLSALLAQLPADFQYVSLQKEVREIDRTALESSGKILHFGDQLRDFNDTAALCELMDLVISVDTSVAHLSGALGKRTWLLLPFVPDWRWLLDREDSPWYPSAKLIRQPAAGDWESVFAKVGADLAQLAAAFPVSP